MLLKFAPRCNLVTWKESLDIFKACLSLARLHQSHFCSQASVPTAEMIPFRVSTQLRTSHEVLPSGWWQTELFPGLGKLRSCCLWSFPWPLVAFAQVSTFQCSAEGRRGTPRSPKALCAVSSQRSARRTQATLASPASPLCLLDSGHLAPPGHPATGPYRSLAALWGHLRAHVLYPPPSGISPPWCRPSHVQGQFHLYVQMFSCCRREDDCFRLHCHS